MPAAHRLGGEGQGRSAILQPVIRRAICMELAYLVGLAQMDCELSVNYAKERVRFDQPIGSFQAIQRKVADIALGVDSARLMAHRAAGAVAEGDTDLHVSMAKAWVSEATRQVVAHGQQIHGGLGFTQEHKSQLYFRHQKRGELLWGTGDDHRKRATDALAL